MPPDERSFGVHERPTTADERFADYDKVAILFVFLLGIGNFALHGAVLSSDHPALARMAWLVGRLGGRGSLLLELVVLMLALLLVDHAGVAWAWAYFGYSALNALGAWLILTNRL